MRVEEVEQLGESNWNITLSWLEEDAAKRIKDAGDPLKVLRIVKEPPPFERVYKIFEIRGDEPVRMKRAPDP